MKQPKPMIGLVICRSLDTSDPFTEWRRTTTAIVAAIGVKVGVELEFDGWCVLVGGVEETLYVYGWTLNEIERVADLLVCNLQDSKQLDGVVIEVGPIEDRHIIYPRTLH